jgi:hypothetical protein
MTRIIDMVVDAQYGPTLARISIGRRNVWESRYVAFTRGPFFPTNLLICRPQQQSPPNSSPFALLPRMAPLDIRPLPNPRPRQRQPIPQYSNRSSRRRPRHACVPSMGRGGGVYGLAWDSGGVRQVAVLESRDQGSVRDGRGLVCVSIPPIL